MIYFKEPQFPARYRIDGVDLYDIHDLNRHGQMLQELAAKDAVLAEREACAKLCEELAVTKRFPSSYEEGFADGADVCANTIRARGEK